VVDNDSAMAPPAVSSNNSMKTYELNMFISITDAIDNRFSLVDLATMKPASSKFVLVEVEDSGIGIPPTSGIVCFVLLARRNIAQVVQVWG
jgi:hypothetical protein